MRTAVIDIGTNSTRLYVCDISAHEQKRITKELETTRLGEGISSSHQMKAAAMERTADAIARFTDLALQYGTEKSNIFIYATAVVREAENKDAFVCLVKERTGLTLDVIPGEIEGQIAFLGAAEAHTDHAVIDIGGGSTEVVTGQNGRLRAFSQKIGCVRLAEKFASPDGIVLTAPVKEYVTAEFIPLYRAHTDIASSAGLIGVSGTPNALSSLFLGSAKYDPALVQGYVFQLSDLRSETEKMAAMPLAQRRIYCGDFAPRADILVYGGCLLDAFMTYYGFDSILVSDRDSLEGYLEYQLSIRA